MSDRPAPKVPIDNHFIKDYDPNVWRKLSGIISGNAPYIPLVKVKYTMDVIGNKYPCELLETHNYPFYTVRYLWAGCPEWLFPEQVKADDSRLVRIME